MSLILPGAFNVKNLGLQSWWDLNSPNHSTVIPANNSALSSLITPSSSAENFSQANGSLQPTYIQNALHTHNAVQFSGSQNMLTGTGNYAANSPITITTLINFAALPAGVAAFLARTSTGGWKAGQYSNGEGYFGTANVHSYISSTVLYTLNTWQVVTISFDAAPSLSTVKIYINKTLVATLTSTTAGSGGVTNTAMYLGSLTGPADFFTGQLNWIGYWLSVPSTTTQQLLENYLMGRL